MPANLSTPRPPGGAFRLELPAGTSTPLAAALSSLAHHRRAADEARRVRLTFNVAAGVWVGLLLAGFVTCSLLLLIDLRAGLSAAGPGRVAVPGLLIPVCMTGGLAALALLGWRLRRGYLSRRLDEAEGRRAESIRGILHDFPQLRQMGGEGLLRDAVSEAALAEVARACGQPAPAPLPPAAPSEAVKAAGAIQGPGSGPPWTLADRPPAEGRRAVLVEALVQLAGRQTALEESRHWRFWVTLALEIVAGVFALSCVGDAILLVSDLSAGRDALALRLLFAHAAVLAVAVIAWLFYRRRCRAAERAVADSAEQILTDFPEVGRDWGGRSALAGADTVLGLVRTLTGDNRVTPPPGRRRVVRAILLGLALYVGLGSVVGPLIGPPLTYFAERDQEERYRLRLTPERPAVVLTTGQAETCRVYLEGGGWDRWDLSAAVVAQDDAGADLRAEFLPAPADGKAKPTPGHRDVRLRAVSGRGEFTVRVAAVSTSGRRAETTFAVRVRPRGPEKP